MWVKPPDAVTSPIAHSRSPARIRSSTATVWASGSSPTVSRPSSLTRARRPTATSSSADRTDVPSSSLTSTPSPSRATCTAFAPSRSSAPSARSSAPTTSPASGSSGGSSRSVPSTTVTRDPKRANICASSRPIAPPPSTVSDSGAVRAAIASRLVQCGVSARPSIGGTTGTAPAATTTARPATKTSSPTRTRPGPSRVADPRTSRPPLPSKRSTATVSSQSSVASCRMRRATGRRSGVTVVVPA